MSFSLSYYLPLTCWEEGARARLCGWLAAGHSQPNTSINWTDHRRESRERRTRRELSNPDTAVQSWCSWCFLMNRAIIWGLPRTQSTPSTRAHHEVEFVDLEVSYVQAQGYPCLLPRDSFLSRTGSFLKQSRESPLKGRTMKEVRKGTDQ